MTVFASIEPRLQRNLRLLFIAGLLFWASLAALLPTLSLYINHIGATKQQVGIVMGSFAIGLLIFRPWLGRLADQRGRRLVLLIGLLVAVTAPIGYLFVTSVPALMGLRAFHGLSIAAFTTGYSALVVDLAPAEKRGELIGYMSLVNPIGMALGPAIGGFVQEWAGYTPLFLTSSALGVAGFAFAWWIRATSGRTIELTDTQPGSFWLKVFSPRFRIPTLVMLMIGLAFGTLSTFVPLFMKETEVNLNAGLFYTTAAIASFLVRLPTGQASDRYGRGLFITISLGLYSAAMLMLWQATSANAFLLAALIEGAGAGMFIPMMIALVADRAQPEERGRVFGLCMTGFDLGIAIAGPTLGFFAEAIGYRSMFGLAGALVFAGLVTFITLSSKTIEQSVQFAFGQRQDLYALPRSQG